MTAKMAPSVYVSGHCGTGGHDRCQGVYVGVVCACLHHTEPEPEPEPVALRIGSLFSGYGGLEEGVRAVLGGTVAWHSEIDPGACKILARRYPDVPNLGDITAVDWSAVEPVDVLTGGFPCQDVSAAGKRAGIRPGTRSGLWTQFAYAIDRLRPPLVVIENVRGLLSAEAHHPAHGDVEPCPWCLGDDESVALRALGAVLGDLAELGFDAEWVGLRAADVGAPHGRFRVFAVAWPAADAGRHPRAKDDTHDHAPARHRRAAPHPARDGRHEGRPEPARLIRGPDAALGGDAPAHADRDALRQQPVALAGCGGAAVAGHAGADAAADTEGDEQREPAVAGSVRDEPRHGAGGVAWGQYAAAIQRWERCLGRPAPSPTERGRNGQPRLSPVFVEWMQGLPAGWVTDVPGLGRNEQLKALGNGVVPQQAAAALRMLLTDVAAPPALVEVGGAA